MTLSTGCGSGSHATLLIGLAALVHVGMFWAGAGVVAMLAPVAGVGLALTADFQRRLDGMLSSGCPQEG